MEGLVIFCTPSSRHRIGWRLCDRRAAAAIHWASLRLCGGLCLGSQGACKRSRFLEMSESVTRSQHVYHLNKIPGVLESLSQARCERYCNICCSLDSGRRVDEHQDSVPINMQCPSTWPRRLGWPGGTSWCKLLACNGSCIS